MTANALKGPLLRLTPTPGTLAALFMHAYKLFSPAPAPAPSRGKRSNPSSLRYRAMLADVDAATWAALRSGDYANPYPGDDKRHARFERQLAHRRRVECLAEL